MLSFGMLAVFAWSIASLNLKVEDGSPLPPSRTAIVTAFANLVKTCPLLASKTPFFLLIVDHFECPDILIRIIQHYFYIISEIFVIEQNEYAIFSISSHIFHLLTAILLYSNVVLS